MKLAAFLTGAAVGAAAITVYYVAQALKELSDLDVTPAFSDWTASMNNNRKTTLGDY